MHLVFEPSRAGIYGVDRMLFKRSLSGRGLAFGIRFTADSGEPVDWASLASDLGYADQAHLVAAM